MAAQGNPVISLEGCNSIPRGRAGNDLARAGQLQTVSLTS